MCIRDSLYTIDTEEKWFYRNDSEVEHQSARSATGKRIQYKLFMHSKAHDYLGHLVAKFAAHSSELPVENKVLLFNEDHESLIDKSLVFTYVSPTGDDKYVVTTPVESVVVL